MRIAIVHYHLRRGGVTCVIENAVAALSDYDMEVIVLTGEPPSTSLSNIPVEVVEGLSYDSKPSTQSFAQLQENLENVARSRLGDSPDIWHFHNHSLGKNLHLPACVKALAASGQHVLLQIHDFPEDGRPANYKKLLQHVSDGLPEKLGEVLYPTASHVHYALLNSRDKTFINQAGLSPQQTHVLPNAVHIEMVDTSFFPVDHSSESSRLFLYPTRAIRRKNIGEFILWAALNNTWDTFGFSMAPENPEALPIYDQWVEFAQSLNVPVQFDMGSHKQFAILLSEAHALVTTSVAEGFGLVFLEAWLTGRPLVGRNLPEVTHEFVEAGVDLSDLYNRFDIPIDLIGADVWAKKVTDHLQVYFKAYGRECAVERMDQAIDTTVSAETIDFGRLDEELQMKVIRHLKTTSELERPVLGPTVSREKIQYNAEIVRDSFGLKQYGERLYRIYQSLLASSPEPLNALFADRVLDQFLSPERINLLRT